MHEALDLLKRAARCREIAEDYHSDIGAPLIQLADTLEERAYRLQPSLWRWSGIFTNEARLETA